MLVLCLTYADATGDFPATAAPPLADDEVTERVAEIRPNFNLKATIPRLSSDATSVEEKKKPISSDVVQEMLKK